MPLLPYAWGILEPTTLLHEQRRQVTQAHRQAIVLAATLGGTALLKRALCTLEQRRAKVDDTIRWRCHTQQGVLTDIFEQFEEARQQQRYPSIIS